MRRAIVPVRTRESQPRTSAARSTSYRHEIPCEVIDRGEQAVLLGSARQGDAPTTSWAHALVFTCELERLVDG